ncbi:glycosyltransferase family 2 protein [Celeribacter indicus]|uniref:Glycosyl transferase family 2 n=1 Tax=Celeribacter indicus TaxID=1208324 RepID=A0A0B5DZ59_9RHOB|nr:glycosyltransferase family 2 protein [Celeribacter indicus]AJE45512.1 hypothetical protein P73_0797 [Celeribacter indicus]SDW87122.1 Glycosyl transferase family 2 [Celeribacter indicus]
MAELIRRMMTARHLGPAVLLGAVATGEDRAELFFSHDSHLSEAMAGTLLEEADIASVGEAPWLRGRMRPEGIDAFVDSRRVEIRPLTPDPELLRGRNVALATRNGESAATVLDWLRFNGAHQGMDGAVILDRAAPEAAERFAAELEAGLHALPPGLRVLLVSFDVPLGLRDTGPEAHPFLTPGAPGKDRMEQPEPDPWSAPFAEILLYEFLRRMYLQTARAVANIDVHDLIPRQGAISVFDLAQEAGNGVVQLAGRQVYPWRVRDGECVRFADHVCVQFDETKRRGRWCVAPSRLPEGAVLRLVRVGGIVPAAAGEFYRYMALRHHAPTVSRIVPKASLIHHPPLIALAESEWGHKPILMPEEKVEAPPRGDNSVTIVTCMKNEGPFILEWLAYHRAIGIEGFLVYTNDCTDGTDALLELLQAKGYVEHRDNRFHGTGLKPQHHALQSAETEPVVTESDWVISMDVDEFVNVKVGDGTMAALFGTLPDANLISCTWRLFGNNDVHGYRDDFLLDQFFRCAPEFANKPHQAWGFKTLAKNVGLFKKLGVHRPKGLKPQIWDRIRWYNGSGKPMPKEEYRNAWRSNASTYGYDMVQLNHYAVRSAESFLVKRDRGRVNHVDRDQGLAYWFRMNNNAEEDRSIQRMIPRARAEFDRLLADPEIRAMHEACVAAHRAKIDALRATESYAAFYAELTGARMEKLSRLHGHFGANVFLSGPESVPDEVIARDPEEAFFFTVERGETAH